MSLCSLDLPTLNGNAPRQGGEEVRSIISFPHDYYVTVVFSTRKLPDEAKAKLMKWTLVEESPPEEAQVIMGWPGDLNGIIQRVKGVRYIQTFSAGVDDLNFDVLPKGVKVFSNAGAYSEAVAEHAWGLILSLAKGIGKRVVSGELRIERGSTFSRWMWRYRKPGGTHR